MKRLNYIFKVNNEVQSNEELNYILNDNKISFIYNKEKYIIHLIEDTITKETEEGNLVINIPNKMIEIKVDKVGHFDMPITIIFYEKNEKIIELEYIIEDDTPIKNNIIIKLI